MSDLTFLITDPQLRVIADPVDSWTASDITLRRNEVSSGSFTAPARLGLMRAISTPGARVIARRNGQILMAGPIEVPGGWKWERDSNGEVTVNWADHLVCLGWRITYPNPARDSNLQNVLSWVRNTNAEDTLRAVVSFNAGPGALPYRQIPRLVLGDYQGGLGTDVPVTTRFEPLLDVCRTIADGGGGLNFGVRQVGTELQFEVWLPEHREYQVRYSIDAGNVTSLSTAPQAPTTTVALVGGSGEGISRPVMEVASASAVAGWGRMETWVSQSDSDDDAQLRQGGLAALADGAESVGLNVTALDVNGQRFGIDYQLGDYVGVVLGAGQAVVDLVTSVQLTNNPNDGEQVTPTIGTGSTKDIKTVRAVRNMERRVGRIERN